jgi:putative transposase
MKRGPWPRWGRVSPDERILAILRQAEGGIPVAELCRAHGMSNASFYKWRAKYGGMDVEPLERHWSE